jgi:hypothetical protein
MSGLVLLSWKTGLWVRVTENHRQNRMHVIHCGSKYPLHHMLALFSSSRTRPDGEEYIRAGTYDLPITKETLPILVEVAQRVRFNFGNVKGFL